MSAFNRNTKSAASLYTKVENALQQTRSALSVPGVINQLSLTYAIDASQVFSFLFWENKIMKNALSAVDAFCPTRQKIDSFKSFINNVLFRQLSPHKTMKNELKSLAHRIRYFQLVFVLAQNGDNRYELLQASSSVHKDDDEDASDEDEDNDIDVSYQCDAPPLILQQMFDTLSQCVAPFSAVFDARPYALTPVCPVAIEINDATTTTDDDDDSLLVDLPPKLIIKTLELMKWCFCALFTLSMSAQSRMEIVDYGRGIVMARMIQFFVLVRYSIQSQGKHMVDMAIAMDHLRSIFLLLKMLCKTVPFPDAMYSGANGVTLLIAEILILNKTLASRDDESTLVLNTVYLHGVSVLEVIHKKRDLVVQHFQRFHRSRHQMLHLCVKCRNVCFGLRTFYLRFCKHCGQELFAAPFNENAISEDGVNMFIPDAVPCQQFVQYYFDALKKFCQQAEFQQFDNDDMFTVIVSYLNYDASPMIGMYIDYQDELGNWCALKIKQKDKRQNYEHRIQVGVAGSKKWDAWIDARSYRIAHLRTFTKATAVTRDDMI